MHFGSKISSTLYPRNWKQHFNKHNLGDLSFKYDTNYVDSEWVPPLQSHHTYHTLNSIFLSSMSKSRTYVGNHYPNVRGPFTFPFIQSHLALATHKFSIRTKQISSPPPISNPYYKVRQEIWTLLAFYS